MTLEISNDYGKIDISNEVIASVVGGKAVECYGIVGMASRQQVRDGIAEILGHENYAKGIKVTENNGVVDIDMYIIVSYGVKISEVANNVQSTVKYTLEKSLNVSVNSIIVKANESLENTPNLLAVLKEVGVVDSGGKGLLCVYEGFLKALKGEKVEAKVAKIDKDEFVHDEHDFHGVINTEDIIYGYCTEMMVRFGKNKKAFDEQEFRQDMSQFGDSLLVINDEEIVKVHVHTEYPGKVFNYGQQYGELIKLKVENMREQHREVIRKEQHTAKPKMETVETAIITISMGEGISEIFKSMGATHIISGGQTMNPSTEDIVKVIEQSKCKRAIILPNNKNILMASEQAASIVDAEAVVIPTKSIPQGISALFQYDVDATLEENKAQMADSVNNVKSGSLTYAVRDTKIDGVEIKKDAFMGLIEDKIVSSQSDQLTTVTELLNEMLAEDSEILTVIIGQDAEQAVTDNMINWIEEQYPDVEVEVHEGGQPIYQYFFSVE